MSGIFNRLELDIMQANELLEGVELTIKHGFPAIVSHPGLASDILRARGRFGGKFKIITPVDWPKGDNFGTVKFRGLSTDAVEADGFEIFLTGEKLLLESRNEIKALTDFIKLHLPQFTEIRFIIGAFSRSVENIESICQAFVGVQPPNFIRTDIPLKLQVNKANSEAHNNLIKKISSIVQIPIKISGNINGVRSITECPIAGRYAVNLTQAKTIVKEFSQQPEELTTILK